MRKVFKVYAIALFLLMGCRGDSGLSEKGFDVSSTASEEEEQRETGFAGDSLRMSTRPGDLLLTAHAQYRLTPIFKVNINKKTKETFIGSVDFRTDYSSLSEMPGNAWHYHIVPGFDAGYGYNLLNIAVHDMTTKQKKELFSSPVLIRTVYFPSFEPDTLMNLPVLRNHYYVTAYDEDTNKDGKINLKDLRRLFRFELDGTPAGVMVPDNFSVSGSSYDPANDLIIVSAHEDANANGSIEDNEPVSVFTIDLKNPGNSGRIY